MINHPFIDSQQLQEHTAEELQTKIAELNKKLGSAGRMNNPYLIGQIRMAITSYQEVYNKKIQDQYKKLNINTKIDINNSASQTNKNTFIDTQPIDDLPSHLT
jgi:protein involved in polysaccharide export with SLBB domain